MGAPPPPLLPPPPPPPPLAAVIVNVRGTGVAAAYLALPAWDAVTVQLPAPVKEILVPTAVQVPDAAKVTSNPDVAVAETASGPGRVFEVISANVMVCGTLTTLNVFVVRPESYVAVDSADAEIVHVPSETPVIVPAE